MIVCWYPVVWLGMVRRCGWFGIFGMPNPKHQFIQWLDRSFHRDFSWNRSIGIFLGYQTIHFPLRAPQQGVAKGHVCCFLPWLNLQTFGVAIQHPSTCCLRESLAHPSSIPPGTLWQPRSFLRSCCKPARTRVIIPAVGLFARKCNIFSGVVTLRGISFNSYFLMLFG